MWERAYDPEWFDRCPTCGEQPGSPDAGPCDGDHECLARVYTQADHEYDAEMAREAARGVTSVDERAS